MSTDVWLAGNTLSYVEGAGQIWIQLNWALSLVDAGCRVTWVELLEDDTDPAGTAEAVRALSERLEPHDLADRLRIIAPETSGSAASVPRATRDELADADLLLSHCYWLPPEWVGAAKVSALVDIDPGLLQIWMSQGDMVVAPHDRYFTIGETVGTPEARFPDCGIDWLYTPPPVHLASWPVVPASPTAPFTTVTHWWEDGWVCFDGEEYQNDKRTSFLEFIEVPRLASVPVELATNLTAGDDDDRLVLGANRWGIRDSREVTRTPLTYRDYIQGSRGEFSVAKPSCTKLRNAWVSDRTICYLASGRPAVVQDTGPSRILSGDAGVLRFTTPDAAARALQRVVHDYDRHARAARALAEHHFDGVQVIRSVLERCW